jgi:hypothetical protein
MARTASVPDSFGSLAARYGQPHGQLGLPTVFTVTTGDVVMPSAHAEEKSSPEPEEAAEPLQRARVRALHPAARDLHLLHWLHQRCCRSFNGSHWTHVAVQGCSGAEEQQLPTPFAASAAHANGAHAGASGSCAAAAPPVARHESMVSEFARAASMPSAAAPLPAARSASGHMAAAPAAFEDGGMRLGAQTHGAAA